MKKQKTIELDFNSIITAEFLPGIAEAKVTPFPIQGGARA
jgi:hypothetical protein